jgi:hypothetical protein
VFLALAQTELKKLRAAKGDPARRAVAHELSEGRDPTWLCDTDKAWPYIDRALSGNILEPREFPPPIELFFKKRLHKAHFYVISLLDLKDLEKVVSLLALVDDKLFRAMFADEVERLHRQGMTDQYLDLSKIDYAWSWLKRIKEFLPHALRANRSVVFHACW